MTRALCLFLIDYATVRGDKPEALLFAFDLLEFNGSDLGMRPVEFRKAKLERLLAKRPVRSRASPGHPKRYYVEHLGTEDVHLLFKLVCGLGCEGIVSTLKVRAISGKRRCHAII